MNFTKNLIGQTFGHLTVIKMSRRRNKKQQVFWVCRCDCGSVLIVRGDNLRLGDSTQCSRCRGKGRPSHFVEGGDDSEWTL